MPSQSTEHVKEIPSQAQISELSYEITVVIHLVLVKLPHRVGDQISSAEALAFDVQLLGLADPT